MRPIVSLRAMRAVHLPEESTVFTLTLGNPYEEPISTALPENDWWRLARLRMSGSDGTMTEIAFPSPPKPSEEAERLVVAEEAEITYAFSLEGMAPVLEPGEYTLSGKIETPDGGWEIPAVQWFAEEPGVMEVALSASPTRSEFDTIFCWTLFHGERLTALHRRTLSRNDLSSAEKMQVFPPERLHEPASDARSLVASACPAPDFPLQQQWVAWLSGRKLCFGVSCTGFHAVELQLPEAPGRILPNLLPRPDGGADVFALRDDRQEFWLARIGGPVLREARSASEHAEAEEEEDVDDPASQVSMAVPELVQTVKLPLACRQGAAGRSIGEAEARLGVVFTAQRGDGIEVCFTLLREEGGEILWSRAFIDHAVLLPATDPVLVFDASGTAHAGVLFRRRTQDNAGDRLQMARLAFGIGGDLQWAEGIGRRDLGAFPSEPVCAALAFHLQEETGQIRCDWCVLLPQNVCWFGGDAREPTFLSSPDTVTQPLTLLNALEYSAVAALTEEGRLRFVTCPIL